MPENLLHLTVRALDELEHIYRLQSLLHISLEQLDSVSPQGDFDTEFLCRAGLLISIYLSQVEPHFEKLKLNLETIRKLKISSKL